ncbi:MAG: hypothetical protein ABF461_01360 [Zymomonas mobilis subsp. pomaceae]|nr:hypothetical protein [Zymomonas mobilis]MDX5948839.1 hypothetical protein [Zymomonas mobilis subsp. pomaceae]
MRPENQPEKAYHDFATINIVSNCADDFGGGLAMKLGEPCV